MDLESEGSVLESVDDNSVIQQCENVADEGKVLDSGPCLSQREKPVSYPTSEFDKDDQRHGEPVNFDSSGVKSPGGASPSKKKGYGLRKWRRIRRDVVKDSSANLENCKILKRVLPGSANSNSKQVHLQSPDVEQNSHDYVAPESLLKTRGVADGLETPGSSLDSRFAAGLAFSAGMEPENSEDRSSKSSTAASAPKVRNDMPGSLSWDKQQAKYLGGSQRPQQGKNRVENSKKPRGERVEKENSHSSMESDSRSTNFVFMQSAFCSSSSRNPSRRVMDYNGENSDEAHTNEEILCRKDNAGEEAEDLSQGDSAVESVNKNSFSSGDMDPLTESINRFLTLQEALEKEIQKFREIGMDPTALHHGANNSGSINATRERMGETSSSHQFETRKVEQRDSTSPDSQISALVENIEYLEVKLAETRSMLEVKESRIRELESTIYLNKFPGEEVASTSESQQEGYRGMEIGAEEAFQQKVEAEIEYLILSRCIENLKMVSDDQMNRARKLEEAHEALNKLGEAETKAEILKKRARKLEKRCGDIVETREVESMKKKACKTTSCLLLQIVLLLVVVLFFISQMLPDSEIVVPT